MKRRYRMTCQKIGMPSWASWSTIVELTDEELEVEGINNPSYYCVFEPLN